MKTIYQLFCGFLLTTHISLLTAMDLPRLNEEQGCDLVSTTLITQDDQLLPVINFPEQPLFEQAKCIENVITSSSTGKIADQLAPEQMSSSSMYAMVVNLSRRIHSLEENIAEKDRQIDKLQEKVADFEATRKIYSGVYKELPCIVRNMDFFHRSIRHLEERGSYQKNFIIHQEQKIKQTEQNVTELTEMQQNIAKFTNLHTTKIEKIEQDICKQNSQQNKTESTLQKLCHIKTQEMQKHKDRLEKEIKAHSVSMNALARINPCKQARGKKRAASPASILSEVDSNFDRMLDIDLESFDEFLSQDQQLYMPSNSATVSVSSQELSDSAQSTPSHVAKRTRLAKK